MRRIDLNSNDRATRALQRACPVCFLINEVEERCAVEVQLGRPFDPSKVFCGFGHHFPNSVFLPFFVFAAALPFVSASPSFRATSLPT